MPNMLRHVWVETRCQQAMKQLNLLGLGMQSRLLTKLVESMGALAESLAYQFLPLLSPYLKSSRNTSVCLVSLFLLIYI